MLVWYIGECMLSITNVNNDIKEPTCGFQNCTTNPLLIVGEYAKVRQSLYNILNHIDTRVNSPRCENLCMVYRSSLVAWSPFCVIIN